MLIALPGRLAKGVKGENCQGHWQNPAGTHDVALGLPWWISKTHQAFCIPQQDRRLSMRWCIGHEPGISIISSEKSRLMYKRKSRIGVASFSPQHPFVSL